MISAVLATNRAEPVYLKPSQMAFRKIKYVKYRYKGLRRKNVASVASRLHFVADSTDPEIEPQALRSGNDFELFRPVTKEMSI